MCICACVVCVYIQVCGWQVCIHLYVCVHAYVCMCTATICVIYVDKYLLIIYKIEYFDFSCVVTNFTVVKFLLFKLLKVTS